MDILQMAVILVLFILLIIPFGKYLYKVIAKESTFADFVFDRIDGFIYKLSGIKDEDMGWKKYIYTLLITNLFMALLAYIFLRIQGYPYLNPNGIKSMEPSLAFNTAISFVTNTNLQDYAGEWGVSYLSQMAVITFLMFTSSATGFAAVSAFIRGISGRPIGNFYIDLVRSITRVLLPFSIIVGIILVSQGVPQTLSKNMEVTTIEGNVQNIPLGPVASLESIKHIGTNGGGFFSANSAHPFENPTPFSNVVEMLSMMLLPGALVYAFGLMVKNKRQGWAIFAAMSVLFLVSLTVCYLAEKSGNPALANLGINQSIGNMEGKEVRFGIAQSSMFTAVTTAFSTGSVNNMHDSLTPLGGMVAMWQMMLNVVFGGKGVGLMNMLMYAIFAVFLSGLMVGRTPEFLGKKIEGREMGLIAIAILIHPFIILISTAVSLMIPQGIESITNPGFHGFSQILYQFTSSSANNGSAFEGLLDNMFYWNMITAIVMFLGRYIPIIILIAIAGLMASKKPVPIGPWTFRTDNALFVGILIAVVIIIGALTFFPAIALGPLAEQLTRAH